MRSVRNSVARDVEETIFDVVYVDKNENLFPHADLLEIDVRQAIQNNIFFVVFDDIADLAEQEIPKQE